MVENGKEKRELDIIVVANKFIKEDDTKFFQFSRAGVSYGATKKGKKIKGARVSIQMPLDICNTDNRNLGEIKDWYIICMAIPKEKVKKFIDEYGE